MTDKGATTSATAGPSAPATAAASSSSNRSTIRLHDNVLLKLPSGVLKPVKVTPNGTVSLGKYGSFKSHLLVGNPYGHTYEVDSDQKIHPIQVTLNDVEETEANNQLIMSTGAQSLTFDDIQALKESGLTGREIIQKQIDEHKAFELKTEYSKDKYLKRKQAKYLQLFTPLEPTVHQIAEYHFDRQPSKTRELRPDTLANLLAMANVRPGSRLLVVEDLGGMVVAAAVERMAGECRPDPVAPLLFSYQLCPFRRSEQFKSDLRNRSLARSFVCSQDRAGSWSSTTPTRLPTCTSSTRSTFLPPTSPRSLPSTGPPPNPIGRLPTCPSERRQPRPTLPRRPRRTSRQQRRRRRPRQRDRNRRDGTTASR